MMQISWMVGQHLEDVGHVCALVREVVMANGVGSNSPHDTVARAMIRSPKTRLWSRSYLGKVGLPGVCLAFMYTSYALIARKIRAGARTLDKMSRDVYSKGPACSSAGVDDAGVALSIAKRPSGAVACCGVRSHVVRQ
jgi:hypothetical protein